MLFSSFTFLFFFLPLVILVYFLMPWRFMKNLILLVSSLFFYAWGEPVHVVIMIIMILVNYCFGLLINSSRFKKAVLFFGVSVNLFVLVFFKYSNFIIENLNSLFSLQIEFANVVMPIGISFYTFQIISYLADVYGGKVKAQKNPIHLALYVSLFPQLIAGPIVRYADVANEIVHRNENIKDIHEGLRRFCFGLGKKIIISNSMAIIANDVFRLPLNVLTFSNVWLGVICFGLQIYYDFSGYSDMAIGLGKVFGFHFLENFRNPYAATSITDFWRRWHISLSSWFRDYVYIPLGGSRHGLLRQIVNLSVVWFLTGLWHGASWNFIWWGLFFLIILIFEKFFLLKVLKYARGIRHLYVLVIVMAGWVIFNSNSTDQMLTMLSRMFQIKMFDINIIHTMNYTYLIPNFLLALLFCFSWSEWFSKFNKPYVADLVMDIVALGIVAICVIYLVNESYNPFIYFRF